MIGLGRCVDLAYYKENKKGKVKKDPACVCLILNNQL